MRQALLWIALGVATVSSITVPAYAGEEEDEAKAASAAVGEQDEDWPRFAVAFSGTRWVPSTELAAVDPLTISADGTVVLSVEPDDVVVPLFGIRYWLSDLVGLDLAMGFNVEQGSLDRVDPNPNPNLTRRSDGSSPSTLAFSARIGIPLSVYRTRSYRLLLMPELDLGYAAKTLEGFALSTTDEPLDLRLTGFGFGIGGRVGAEVNFSFIGVPNLSVQSAWGARFESRRREGRIGDAQVIQSDVGFGTSWYGDGFDIFVGSLAVNYYL